MPARAPDETNRRSSRQSATACFAASAVAAPRRLSFEGAAAAEVPVTAKTADAPAKLAIEGSRTGCWASLSGRAGRRLAAHELRKARQPRHADWIGRRWQREAATTEVTSHRSTNQGLTTQPSLARQPRQHPQPALPLLAGRTPGAALSRSPLLLADDGGVHGDHEGRLLQREGSGRPPELTRGEPPQWKGASTVQLPPSKNDSNVG